MKADTDAAKRGVSESVAQKQRAIRYAKWDLDDARATGDKLKIDLAEAALNATLENYGNGCNT